MRFIGIGRLAAALILTFAALPAQAAIITQNFFGVVTAAGANNDLDIETGDVLRGTVTFDAALLTGGIVDLNPETDPALALHIELGRFGFDAEDDTDFPVFPVLGFRDSELISISYRAVFGDGDFVLFLTDGAFTISPQDGSGILVEGIFDTAAVVPEPMTLAMFGLGLAGIGLIRCRRA
jgi:hypothetical protein